MRPLSFGPGKAIGDVTARAVGAARAVDWRRVAKVASKVVGHLPKPGDGPLALATKALTLVNAFDESGGKGNGPYYEGRKQIEMAGGKVHDGVEPIVEMAVESWSLASDRPVGSSEEALLEYRHPRLGRAWLVSLDSKRETFFHYAGLEPGVEPAEVARELWAARGARLRLDVSNDMPTPRAKLSRAGGLGRRLYGAGAARLAELVAEQTSADARGEGVVYLLSGPPGTGKTTVAACLAESLGSTLLIAGGSALAHHDLHFLRWTESALAPGVLVLDDLDRSLPSDIAPMLGWLQARRERPGAVVLTANGSLPAALIREGRVDHVVAVSPPTPDERLVTLRALLADLGVPEPADLDRVVEATEGRGEAALVDAARRLRDRPVEVVVEQIRRRRAIEAGRG